MGLGIGNGIWWSDNDGEGGGGDPETFYLMTEDSQNIMTEDNAHLITE
tara:strand:+ start:1665 stop:1808 length:144 start_codon:yes stop_codon:yes gene_type:complete